MDTTPDKWLSLLLDNRTWLRAVIYARVRSWDAVEDVFQETALAATQNGDPARDGEGISRWLYRVAVRQSLLYLRKQVRHRRRVDGWSEQNSTRDNIEHSPLTLVESAEQQELVRRGMERLGNRECEILLLKYSEGWSCAEIANRLEISENAVKSRLLRARRNLRSQLIRLTEDWEA